MITVLESDSNHGPVKESSDRSFGIVFAAVFAIVACVPLLHLEAPRWWALGVAIAFLAIALVRPQTLRPLNRIWLAVGRLLHQIMSPLVMGTIFFGCITPIAWIMRLMGKDVLSLSRRPDHSSYWIPRPPSRPAAETMKQQF